MWISKMLLNQRNLKGISFIITRSKKEILAEIFHHPIQNKLSEKLN